MLREAERQSGVRDKQWKLRRDRAACEARLAERRYKAVDPDNRVAARTLECEWNDNLQIVEVVEREYREATKREGVALTDEKRRALLHISQDLPRVWRPETTLSFREEKSKRWPEAFGSRSLR